MCDRAHKHTPSAQAAAAVKQRGCESINFYYLRTFPVINSASPLTLDENELCCVVSLLASAHYDAEQKQNTHKP